MLYLQYIGLGMKFIGRKEELKLLRTLFDKRSASLVIVKGRRRIGKSRLIKEFAKDSLFYEFAGIPPENPMTAQMQREVFKLQLEKKFNLSDLKADDWGSLFSVLAKQTCQGKVIILLDEISWMGSKDPTFLGNLKNAWDMEFSSNPNLILILCGSVSSWIEKNIVNSTGFVGRPSLHLTLEGLPLSDCNLFWDKLGGGVSAYEKLKLLSVIGGVPRYLELMDPKLPAEENIKQLCFSLSGPLFEEFDHIFTDVFSERNKTYRKIIELLSENGSSSQEKLVNALSIVRSSDIGEHLDDLILGGFVSRDYTWKLKTGKISRLSTYRLKDNYTRFYLKYIMPNKASIEKGNFAFKTLTALPGWDAMMGLQFENLVLNNHKTVKRLLDINPQDIIFDNPFFQRKTNRQDGCQIDYLVQTRFNTVYICEIKFSRFEIGPEVISQVEEKIKRLALPRHISYRPVLIHVNGVREDVVDSGFFAQTIDFGNLLTFG